MKIAFHAPLKPPDHPVPSGDRQLGRMLLRALAVEGDVAVASRLRSFDAHGDALRQARLSTVGQRLARRLVARYAGSATAPDLWFTYHVYHKAPDLLGPTVSRALAIPYVVAEASIAPKQRHGPWAGGYAQSVAAVRAADAVVCVNPVDVAQVRAARAADAIIELLPPFIDVVAFTKPPAPARHGPVRLIAVGMMREQAKLASYRVLAAALDRIDAFRYAPPHGRPRAARALGCSWELVIVGDGPARAEVERAFAPVRSRVHFAGACAADEVRDHLAQSDVFVWPAIDEAFGMALIEAQACGLPVVAGDSEGVGAVVAAGRSGLLVPAGDAAAFAAAVARLIGDAELRAGMAREALAYVRERHDLPRAAAQLGALLRRVCALHPFTKGHAPPSDGRAAASLTKEHAPPSDGRAAAR